MALDKAKLRVEIKKVTDATKIKTPADATKQWNIALKTYVSDLNILGYKPQTFKLSISDLFDKSIKSKTLLEDFGKHLFDWSSGIAFSNGQDRDTKSPKIPPALDFKTFSQSQNKVLSGDVYLDNLSDYLHKWFLQIASF